MDIKEKFRILTEGAKYDVSCSSSGSDRNGKKGKLGFSNVGGICHSFTADGRCISLLKVLMFNNCIYNCKYCVNRSSVFRSPDFAMEFLIKTVWLLRTEYGFYG